jgi:hypothetical protein
MGGAHPDMATVSALGLKLPHVTTGLYYGSQALKLNGRMLACTPVNKSAEVNSAVIAMGFEERDKLLKRHPSLYYITDHYAPHPTVLIRLSRVSKLELARTLRIAHGFVSAQGAAPRSGKRVTARSKAAPAARQESRRRQPPSRLR